MGLNLRNPTPSFWEENTTWLAGTILVPSKQDVIAIGFDNTHPAVADQPPFIVCNTGAYTPDSKIATFSSTSPTLGYIQVCDYAETQGFIAGYNSGETFLQGVAAGAEVAIRQSGGSYASFHCLDINLTAESVPTAVAGKIYFSGTDAHFYGYNGTTWKQLDN